MKKIARIITPLTALLVVGVLYPKQQPSHVKLESEALAFADGKSYGFSAERIRETYKLAKHLDEMIYGVRQKNNKVVGLFTYKGSLHTVEELTTLEKKLGLRNGELAKTLSATKEYFGLSILPAMKDVKSMRDIIIDLIKESCQKRDRLNSFLLTWGSCKEGQEKETFMKGLNSFEELNQFLIDLQNFLKDIIFSCPKAVALLKDLAKHQ